MRKLKYKKQVMWLYSQLKDGAFFLCFLSLLFLQPWAALNEVWNSELVTHTSPVGCTILLSWIRGPCCLLVVTTATMVLLTPPSSQLSVHRSFCHLTWRVCPGQASGAVELQRLVGDLRAEEPVAGKVKYVSGQWAACVLVLAWEDEAVQGEAERLPGLVV